MENLDCFVTSTEKAIAEALLQAAETQNIHLSPLFYAVKIAGRFCRSDDRGSDPLWIELCECLYCAAKAAEKKSPPQTFGAGKGPEHEWSMWAADAALRAHRAAMILSARVEGKQGKIIEVITNLAGWRKANRVLWAAYSVAADNW
jgi:hypothetical protein